MVSFVVKLMSQTKKCIEANFCSNKSDSFSEKGLPNICQLGRQYKCLSNCINTAGKTMKHIFQSEIKATFFQFTSSHIK